MAAPNRTPLLLDRLFGGLSESADEDLKRAERRHQVDPGDLGARNRYLGLLRQVGRHSDADFLEHFAELRPLAAEFLRAHDGHLADNHQPFSSAENESHNRLLQLRRDLFNAARDRLGRRTSSPSAADVLVGRILRPLTGQSAMDHAQALHFWHGGGQFRSSPNTAWRMHVGDAQRFVGSMAEHHPGATVTRDRDLFEPRSMDMVRVSFPEHEAARTQS